MDFEIDIQNLQNELEIPRDKFNLIINDLCRNFVKKYERNINIDANSLSLDLKSVIKNIEVYSQYTIETIGKYRTLNKLQSLVRSITEGQAMILNYLSNILNQQLQDKSNYEKKIQNITYRIYERCQNCAKPLKQSQLDNTQVQIGMKFRDLHSYFQQDLSEIHKLSEEAELILKKKSLNIEGIAEEQYIHKIQKMEQNITTTIQNVSKSLESIVVFQQKFSQIQQYQYHLTKNQRQKTNGQIFNSKRYAVDFSKHFYTLIKNLEQKLNQIKRYFKSTEAKQTQTYNEFNECTPEKIKQLKQLYLQAQAERRQIQIYKSSLEQQVLEMKNKLKIVEQNYITIKGEKQKCDEKVKILQVQLEMKVDKQVMKRKQLEVNQRMIEALKLNQNRNSNKNISGFTDLVIQQEEKKGKITNQQTSKSIADEVMQYLSSNHENLPERNKKYSKVSTFDYNKKQKQIISPFSAKEPIKMVNQSNFRKRQKKQSSLAQHQQNKVKQNIASQKINEKAQQIQYTKRQFKSSGSLLKHKYTQKNAVKNIEKIIVMEPIRHTKQQNEKKQKANNLDIFKQFCIDINQQQRQSNKTSKINRSSKNKLQKFIIDTVENNVIQNQQTVIDKNLRNIFETLKQNEFNQQLNIKYEDFRWQFNKFMNSISHTKQQNNYLNQSKIYFAKLNEEQKYFSQTHSKSKSVFKILENNQQRDYSRKQQNFKRHSQNIQQLKSPYQRKIKTKEGHLNWNKTNTQANCDEIITKHLIRDIKQSRNQSNTISQQHNDKFLLRFTKFNGFSNTTDINNKAGIQTLPSLKKRSREQSFNFNHARNSVSRKSGEQMLQNSIVQNLTSHFTVEDVKAIFSSVQNAYYWSQTSLKHRKSLSGLGKEEEMLNPTQIKYMKEFFAKLASLHLCNKNGYQKMKLFLICPYDSVITQMAQLKLIKPGLHSNAMRQSVCKIIILHRNCTIRGDICKHLKYLSGKVSQLEREGRMKENQLHK